MTHSDLCTGTLLTTVRFFKRAVTSPGDGQYPNHLEREAMILSTFAGMVLVSLGRD
uniref:Uncharacterized protein n=1 Tax=Anguilla anguilla TaxID=7936 RepID=A0A0E9R3L0_ANGAN